MPHPAPENRVQTRVDRDTFGWLTDRADRMRTGSHHLQAKHELALWRAVLAAELGRLRLTLPEATCLAGILRRTTLDTTLPDGPVGLVYLEVFAAFQRARETPLPGEATHADACGVDEESLLRRLGQLGPAGDHALRDAFTRWWLQDGRPTADEFTDFGLTITPPP